MCRAAAAVSMCCVSCVFADVFAVFLSMSVSVALCGYVCVHACVCVHVCVCEAV